jgi:hypothetical protein
MKPSDGNRPVVQALRPLSRGAEGIGAEGEVELRRAARPLLDVDLPGNAKQRRAPLRVVEQMAHQQGGALDGARRHHLGSQRLQDPGLDLDAEGPGLDAGEGPRP